VSSRSVLSHFIMMLLIEWGGHPFLPERSPLPCTIVPLSSIHATNAPISISPSSCPARNHVPTHPANASSAPMPTSPNSHNAISSSCLEYYIYYRYTKQSVHCVIFKAILCLQSVDCICVFDSIFVQEGNILMQKWTHSLLWCDVSRGKPWIHAKTHHKVLELLVTITST
jgi:hypothetical protein